MVIDPRDPDVMYVGTQDAGIYKSVDSGASWQPANQGLSHATILSLAIDPQEPRRLYAGIFNDGLYKATDGGAHWEAVSIIVKSSWRNVSTVIVDPRNGQHVYYTNGTGVYYSSNGGNTWVRASMCPNGVFWLAIRQDDTVLAATPGSGNTTAGVFQVSLGTGVCKLTGQDSGIFFLVRDDKSQKESSFYALQTSGTRGLYYSANGGDSW